MTQLRTTISLRRGKVKALAFTNRAERVTIDTAWNPRTALWLCHIEDEHYAAAERLCELMELAGRPVFVGLDKQLRHYWEVP